MVDGDFSEADVVELLYNWLFYGLKNIQQFLQYLIIMQWILSSF